MSREWTVSFVMPCPWLTANIDRDKFKRANLVKKIRLAVVEACQYHGLPQGIGPCTLHAKIRYSGRTAPVRDRLNLAPTLKAIVDGLTPPKSFMRNGKRHDVPGYGLIADDSDKHVLNTTWELGRIDPAVRHTPYGVIHLTIVEQTKLHEQLSLIGADL